eukprot:TRINITY_DN8606_c0_g1_i1.p1 TRINITY_DN8606_c0_g1~~TRINITY_DN8606_c0_g1_i1.p1  ORF type:complete len:349 (+),score=63.74 TRINITY_DN8606_c0_g1_i1:180-1226(+)
MGRGLSEVEDLYATLDVSPRATQEEVKRAYHKLALEVHPDRARGKDGSAEKEQSTKENEEKFKRVKHAYDVLGDPVKRGAYNQTITSAMGDSMSSSTEDPGVGKSCRRTSSMRKGRPIPAFLSPSLFPADASRSPKTSTQRPPPCSNLGSSALPRSPGTRPRRGSGSSPRSPAAPSSPPNPLLSTRFWVMVLSLVLAGLLASGQRGLSVPHAPLASGAAGPPAGWETEKLLRPSVRVTGSCEGAVGRFIDGDFVAIGMQNGRPYYRHRVRKSILYFDPACDVGAEPGWYIRRPEDPASGRSCSAIAKVEWAKPGLPSGISTWSIRCDGVTFEQVDLSMNKVKNSWDGA